MKKVNVLLSTVILLTSWTIVAAPTPAIDCDKSKHCTFVLLDASTGKLTLKNVPRALKRYSPFSTFKIANTAYGFETGVLRSIEQPLPWEQDKYPVQAWWPKNWTEQQHSVKSAFQASALPLFQTLVNHYQPEKLAHGLKNYRYGNADISSGLDRFWLNGSLQISAIEQVKMLRRLFENHQVLAKQHSESLKQVMLSTTLGNYKKELMIYAKTGADLEQKNFGWLVGAINKEGHWYYFATNVDGASFEAIQKSRRDIAKYYLSQLGILPSNAVTEPAKP